MQAARDKQSGGGGKLCWEVGQRKQAQVRHTLVNKRAAALRTGGAMGIGRRFLDV